MRSNVPRNPINTMRTSGFVEKLTGCGCHKKLVTLGTKSCVTGNGHKVCRCFSPGKTSGWGDAHCDHISYSKLNCANYWRHKKKYQPVLYFDIGIVKMTQWCLSISIRVMKGWFLWLIIQSPLLGVRPQARVPHTGLAALHSKNLVPCRHWCVSFFKLQVEAFGLWSKLM